VEVVVSVVVAGFVDVVVSSDVVVAGFVDVVVSSLIVMPVCATANGVSNAQTKPIIALFTLILLFMVNFTHKFVTHGLNGRSLSVPCFDWLPYSGIRIICCLRD
jgi:hypothetical protein